MKSFQESVEDLGSEIDLIVTLDDVGFPESTVDKILDLAEVKTAQPVLRQNIFLELGAGTKRMITLVGIDLLNQGGLTSKASGKNVVRDPLVFMSNAQSVAVSKGQAKRFGLKEEGSLTVLTPLGSKNLVINATFEAEEFTEVYGENLVVMDIEAARLLFKREDKTDQINVTLQPTAELSVTQKKIQAAIGQDYVVAPPSQLVENLKSTIQPFQLVLNLMAFLTFVLVLYLLVNLSANGISERRKEYGILRALGCSQKRLAFTMLTEHGLLAISSSLGGVALAWNISGPIANKLNAIVSSQYGTSINLNPGHFDYTIPLMIAGASNILILVSLSKNILTICRISPTEAISPVSSSTASSKPASRSLIFFLVTFAPVFIIDSSGLIFIIPLVGAILFGPDILMLFLILLKKWKFLSRLHLGRLACDYAQSNPRRAGPKLRGMIIGLVIIFVVSLVQSSFESALKDRFVRSSRPDMFVTANAELTSPLQLQPLHEDLAVEIAKIPGVTGVYGQRITKLNYQGKSVTLRAFDEVHPENNKLSKPYAHFDIVDRPAEEAGHELYHSHPVESSLITILASETLQNRFQLKTGDELELNSPKGKLRARIVGIIRDLSAGAGAIYLSREVYRHWWEDKLISGFALTTDRSKDEMEIKAAIEQRFSDDFGTVVTLDKKLQQDILSAVEKGFYYMTYIQLLIILVALVNFVSAFLFEIRSRSKEYATLRSVGLSKVSLFQIVLWETFFLILGTVGFSYLVSLGLASRLLTTGLTSALGWYVSFHFDFLSSFLLVTLSALAITAVGIIPAIKSTTIDIGAALKND